MHSTDRRFFQRGFTRALEQRNEFVQTCTLFDLHALLTFVQSVRNGYVIVNFDHDKTSMDV